MAAWIESSSMIFSTRSFLVLWALGPAFSNFLKRPSTVLWSFLSRVTASMPDCVPGRGPFLTGEFGLKAVSGWVDGPIELVLLKKANPLEGGGAMPRGP